MMIRNCLRIFRPNTQINPNFYTFRVECEEARESDDPDLDPSELPVQGPLPQEPEDAPWKRNESGIRRL